jgi:hypothetical protein
MNGPFATPKYDTSTSTITGARNSHTSRESAEPFSDTRNTDPDYSPKHTHSSMAVYIHTLKPQSLGDELFLRTNRKCNHHEFNDNAKSRYEHTTFSPTLKVQQMAQPQAIQYPGCCNGGVVEAAMTALRSSR